MKIRRFAFVALSLVIPAVTVSAADSKTPAHEETELEAKMDVLNGAFRKLRRQVGDPTKNGESLTLVADMRKAAEESLLLVPAKAADLPADERAKFTMDYRTRMKVFTDSIGKLETALKADKNEDAARIIAELSAAQREGHKQFRKATDK